MKHIGTALVALLLCLAARDAAGDEVIQSIDWQELATSNGLSSGTVVESSEPAAGPVLRVTHQGGPETLHLLTLDQPSVSAARYALRGRVAYEGVAAGSYLEMWNHLPDGAFFSRALAPSGPMGGLDGSSEWRDFVLPFFNREGGAPPNELVFNLVMAGSGSVEIGSLELVQFGPDEDVLADATGWWSNRQAGLMGGVMGSVLGVLGAAIGWLSSTGRAKGFVFGALRTVAGLGVVAIILGGLALANGQPYAVYYPLLLIGAISATLGLALPRSLGKRYEERELRRMQALDA